MTQSMSFRVAWHGRHVEGEAAIPTEPVRPRILLPLVQHLANAVVSLAEAAVKDAGKAISCRAGCGACCRQLVPVSRTEAHHLNDLIEAMPEPRRQVVRDRFASGKQRLIEAGMLEVSERAADSEDRLAVGRDYFRLGIACPFLEEESCSIHADRPLACREYLVTSPPDLCRAEHEGTIRKVVLPARPMTAFARLDGDPSAERDSWVPLLLAPEWAEAIPEPEPTVSGVDLFSRFLRVLNPGSAGVPPALPGSAGVPPALPS